MGQLMNQNPNQGWSGDSHTHDVLNVNLNGQDTNGNYSNISIWLTAYHDGGWSENGTWVGQAWLNGGLAINASESHNIGTGETQVGGTWTGNVGHDANGNASPYIEYYFNQPATSMSRRGANWGLPRIALAPSISSMVPSALAPTTATIGIELSTYGHGTSAAMYPSYRKQGSSTWIPLSAQTDVAGYNYFNLTGLIPGTTYEFYGTTYNNNGDTSTTGTQTFQTLPAPNASTPLFRIIGLS